MELGSYEGLHLLDLTWKLVIGQPHGNVSDYLDLKPVQILSASHLNEKAQVQLMKSETNNLNDGIRFDNGVLRVPIFRIHFPTFPTESVLLNLVAFEHLHAGTSQQVSSYIDFMSALVNSAKDSSMIRNINAMQTIWNDEAVPKFFQKIRNDMGFNPCYSYKLHDMALTLNEYCITRTKWRRRLHEWGSTLKENYLKNPWTLIALIAATLLLVCTIIQTITGLLSLKYNNRY
ncbi:UPF0481 protein At3g47200-like [Tasmannia lanceolata]|uniref:UPF0481 protein At3g47200-like n=1 Tax=Tasmannia lanceolata TaxID=3420 RepID=UPI004063D8B6